MKKIITLLFIVASLVGRAQISDVKTKDTIDLYILTNNAKAITSAQVNKILTHLNTNKLHVDSAAFYVSGVKIISRSGLDTVQIDAATLYAPSLTVPVGKFSKVMAYNSTGYMFPQPIVVLYDEIQDTLRAMGRGDAMPRPDSIYYALIDTNYTDIDTNSISSFRTASAFLPNWRADFSNAQYPEMTATDNNASIAIIGDSYGNSTQKYLGKYAQYLYGQGGGYQPFVNTAIATNGTYCAIGANWTSGIDATDTLILNSGYAESSTAGASIALGYQYFNKFRVFYKQISGGGTFSYQVGAAGTPTNVSTDGATAAKWCYKNFGELKSSPTDTIFIKVVSGSVRLYGFYFQNDYRPLIFNESPCKLEVHNLAIGGTTVSQMTGKNATAVKTLIDTLDISAFLMIWLDSDAEDPYTNYPILISELRAAKATTDYLIMSPYNNYLSWGTSQAKKYRALAKSLNVGYLNMANLTGQYDKNNAAGIMADVTHFNFMGESMIYLELAKMLFQPLNTFGKLEATRLIVNNNTLQFPNSNSIYIGSDDRSTKTTLYNTAVGYEALGNFTTGYSNTAIGNLALEDNTDGYQNTAIGKGALGDNTTGYDNIAIGFLAGNKQVAVDNNISIGRSAAAANVSGTTNVVIGNYAFETATDKTGVVILGNFAGRYNVNNGNTFVGYVSGIGVSGATNNGYGNAYLGYGSGQYTNTGYRSVAIGYEAMRGKTTSTYYAGGLNVAIGYQAMLNVNSSENTVSIGTQSGYTLSTGSRNTHLGANSAYLNSTGTNNIMIGYRSGYNETGSYRSYWAADSTSWAVGMASGSKLLWYADQSNADKANHFMNIFAKVVIGEAKALSDYSLEVVGNANITTSATIGTFLKLTPMADPPGSAEEGMIYMDTDHALYVYNGSVWQQIAVVP